MDVNLDNMNLTWEMLGYCPAAPEKDKEMKPTCKSLDARADKQSGDIDDLVARLDELDKRLEEACDHRWYRDGKSEQKALQAWNQWAVSGKQGVGIQLQRKCLTCGHLDIQEFDMMKRGGRKAANRFMSGK